MTKKYCEKCDVLYFPELDECSTCRDKRLAKKKAKKVEDKPITVSRSGTD